MKWYIKILKTPKLLLVVLLAFILMLSVITASYRWYSKRYDYSTLKKLSESSWKNVSITMPGMKNRISSPDLQSVVRNIMRNYCTSNPPQKTYANQYIIEITDKSDNKYEIYLSQYAWQFSDSDWMFLAIIPSSKLSKFRIFIEEGCPDRGLPPRAGTDQYQSKKT